MLGRDTTCNTVESQVSTIVFPVRYQPQPKIIL